MRLYNVYISFPQLKENKEEEQKQKIITITPKIINF